MVQKEKLDLTKNRIGSVILAFVLPLMLGSLIQQLYTMTDAVIVGRFAGKMGLAAIDSVHTLFKFPINFMNGLAAGATILISSAFGAKNARQTRQSVQSSIAVAVVLGVVASVGGVLLSPWLLRLLSVPQDIYGQTLTYTRIYFGGLWSMVLYNMVAGILRAMGDTKRPLYVLVTSCIVNILGDILLVGVFRMGVAGAAAATAAAQIISAAAICRCLDRTLEGGIFGANQIRIPVGDMLSIFKIGMPLALQSTLFPIANTIVQAGVNQMGTDAIAAWGICGKLDMLIWLIADTMSPALTTYVAQNIGAKQWHRVRRGTLTGAAMSAGAVGMVSLVLYVGAGTFGRWFIAEQDAAQIVPLVSHYMALMCPFYVFYTFAESFSGACCGTGDTLSPMVTTLLTICLFRVIGILFVLPRYESMDCIIGIYISSWILSGAAFAAMFAYKFTGKPGNSPVWKNLASEESAT